MVYFALHSVLLYKGKACKRVVVRQSLISGRHTAVEVMFLQSSLKRAIDTVEVQKQLLHGQRAWKEKLAAFEQFALLYSKLVPLSDESIYCADDINNVLKKDQMVSSITNWNDQKTVGTDKNETNELLFISLYEQLASECDVDSMQIELSELSSSNEQLANDLSNERHETTLLFEEIARNQQIEHELLTCIEKFLNDIGESQFDEDIVSDIRKFHCLSKEKLETSRLELQRFKCSNAIFDAIISKGLVKLSCEGVFEDSEESTAKNNEQYKISKLKTEPVKLVDSQGLKDSLMKSDEINTTKIHKEYKPTDKNELFTKSKPNVGNINALKLGYKRIFTNNPTTRKLFDDDVVNRGRIDLLHQSHDRLQTTFYSHHCTEHQNFPFNIRIDGGKTFGSNLDSTMPRKLSLRTKRFPQKVVKLC